MYVCQFYSKEEQLLNSVDVLCWSNSKIISTEPFNEMCNLFLIYPSLTFFLSTLLIYSIIHSIIVRSNLFFLPITHDAAKKLSKDTLEQNLHLLNTAVKLNTLTPEVSLRELSYMYIYNELSSDYRIT